MELICITNRLVTISRDGHMVRYHVYCQRPEEEKPGCQGGSRKARQPINYLFGEHWTKLHLMYLNRAPTRRCVYIDLPDPGGMSPLGITTIVLPSMQCRDENDLIVVFQPIITSPSSSQCISFTRTRILGI